MPAKEIKTRTRNWDLHDFRILEKIIPLPAYSCTRCARGARCALLLNFCFALATPDWPGLNLGPQFTSKQTTFEDHISGCTKIHVFLLNIWDQYLVKYSFPSGCFTIEWFGMCLLVVAIPATWIFCKQLWCFNDFSGFCLIKWRSFTDVEHFETNHGVFSKGKPSLGTKPLDVISQFDQIRYNCGCCLTAAPPTKRQLVLRPIVMNKSTIDLSLLTLDTDHSN